MEKKKKPLSCNCWYSICDPDEEDLGICVVVIMVIGCCFITLCVILWHNWTTLTIVPIRPYIYMLSYEYQSKIYDKIGFNKLPANTHDNVAYAFEQYFSTRISNSWHLVETPEEADIIYAGFSPLCTHTCYRQSRCRGEDFESSFNKAVATFGSQLAQIDSSIPVFIGIGETNVWLMRLLVERWKRDLIYVTPYQSNKEESQGEVNGWRYETIVIAPPNLNRCENSCKRKVRKHHTKTKELSELLLPAAEESEDSESADESQTLMDALGKKVHRLVYPSDKKHTVLVTSDVVDRLFLGEPREGKRMQAINLDSKMKKKSYKSAHRRYRKAIKSSKFCIHRFEDLRDIRGFFESLSEGCIPIFSKVRNWELPYANSFMWDYSRFAYEVEFEKIDSILGFIDALPESDVRQKQYAVFMVKRRLSWYSSSIFRTQDDVRDAFDLTLLELFFRAVLKPQKLKLRGNCKSLQFALPRLNTPRDLLKPGVADFLDHCANITVTPRDFMVDWLDLNYGKQEL